MSIFVYAGAITFFVRSPSKKCTYIVAQNIVVCLHNLKCTFSWNCQYPYREWMALVTSLFRMFAPFGQTSLSWECLCKSTLVMARAKATYSGCPCLSSQVQRYSREGVQWEDTNSNEVHRLRVPWIEMSQANQLSNWPDHYWDIRTRISPEIGG